MKTLAIIIVSMLMGAMCAPYMAQAIDRKAQADQLMIERHKLYVAGYLDNIDNEQDLDESAEYLASAEYKAAKSANEFLRKIREVGYE